MVPTMDRGRSQAKDSFIIRIANSQEAGSAGNKGSSTLSVKTKTGMIPGQDLAETKIIAHQAL